MPTLAILSKSVAQRWREEAASAEGTPENQVRGLIFSCALGFGLLLITHVQLVMLVPASLVWLGLPIWAKATRFARLHVALAFAFSLTMLGVCMHQTILPKHTYWSVPIPYPVPFGEHPVTILAGFPWQGVEGCWPYAWARDRIPFDMGVDALLANMLVFAALLLVLLRRAKATSAAGLTGPAGAIAAMCGFAGGWQLMLMFD